jgi:hypothetical protein
MPGFLARARQQLDLTSAEASLLATAGVRSWDSAHGVLLHSPSLGAEPGIRREHLIAALQPLLSDGYRAALATPVEPPASGVLPPPGWRVNDWFIARLDQADDIDLSEEPAAVALLTRADDWAKRDQGVLPTCIAFATVACLERLRAGVDEQFVQLSPIFLYNRMRNLPNPPNPPPGWPEGATKFAYAKEVLAVSGICEEVLWSDQTSTQTVPDNDVLETARADRVTEVGHCDYPDPKRRPFGIARLLLRQLRAGFPTAIAVPEFADKKAYERLSNWWQPHVRVSGVVPDRLPGWEVVAGHAVCVLGFLPEVGAPGGGWFIFRNNFRDRWATAPVITGDDPPVMPSSGYGAISARYVENECWELLTPGTSLDCPL